MTFDDAKNAVLQTRRYDTLMGRSRNFRQMLTDYLIGLVESLFERFDFTLPTGGDAQWVPLVFAIAGGILLLVGTYVFVRALLRSRRPKIHDLSDIFEELKNRDYTVTDLIQLSEEADDRRVAIRYRYIAVLLSMNERALIQIRPSATNALILKELKQAHPALAKPFTTMANIYHLSWYGYKTITDETIAEYKSMSTLLIAGVQHG